MKKRVLSAIAAGVLAAAMCIGFAACGEEKAPDPETMKSEKIESAEAWAAAFDFDGVTDYKMHRSIASKVTAEGETATFTITTTITVTPTAISSIWKTKTEGKRELLMAAGISTPEVEGDDERCYTLGDTIKQYWKIGGKWYVGEVDEIEVDDLSALEWLKEEYAGVYDEYEYSEEHGGYIPKNGEITQERPIIKFKDGRFCALYAENGRKEGNASLPINDILSISFVFGKQSVKLPASAIPVSFDDE